VVGGVKLNKLIFSVLLVGLLAIFMIIVPVLYKLAVKILDHSAVPVPRQYQVLAFILVFVLTSLIKHGKNAEILECGGALLFFLIVRYSKNREIFSPT
jgi:quinol-cytochrome oxidoreductase complex cytochrome b subunit